MAGFTQRLLEGVAQYLEDEGVAAWAPHAPAAPGVASVGLGSMPDRGTVVLLATYPASAPGDAETGVGVQVRVRADDDTGDPTATNDLADDVLDVLDGLWSHTLPGGIEVATCSWANGVGAQQGDGDNRSERVDSYLFVCHRETKHSA